MAFSTGCSSICKLCLSSGHNPGFIPVRQEPERLGHSGPIIVERTKAGPRSSRLRGRVGGRSRALDQTKLTVAQTLMVNGNLSMAEIARQVGCAPSTLYRSLPGGRRGSTTMVGTVPDGRAAVREMTA